MARHRTSTLALTAAALTAALLVTGCSMSGGPVKKAERTYTVDGKVTTVDVATHGGEITVLPVTGGDGKVRVTERYEYSDSKPDPEHRLENGKFTIDKATCGGALHGRCTVSVEVHAPRTADLRLSTSGGNITVRGASGTVAADTRGGNVTLEDCASRSATAHTKGGDVTASFTVVPDSVDGRTSGGDVRIRLPKGTYAVDASTSGGNREVVVPTDEGSAHKVTARTQGGDVRVLGQ
ncbi:DUF4097 family beta strand repeat-containing protein [Streptomyces luteireticuli]|uniref:DUF4097 domain-containing protein n=1 Tax=Streptomyces luteireticuli TaxID=173858 RepID=A0ABP3IL63_9ACTN